MATAVQAMPTQTPRENTKRKYTPEDNELLLSLVERGLSDDEIAVIFGRSAIGINAKRRRLLVAREARETAKEVKVVVPSKPGQARLFNESTSRGPDTPDLREIAALIRGVIGQLKIQNTLIARIPRNTWEPEYSGPVYSGGK